MATSGSHRVLAQQTLGMKTYLEFSWSLDSQNIAGNYSQISWQLRFYGEDGGFNSYIGERNYSIRVFDSNYKGSSPVAIGTNGERVLASGTTAIPHNNDGSREFGVWYGVAFGGAMGDVTGGEIFTLPDIPRKATLLTAPNFTDEDNPNITYSNPAGAAMTILQACIANSTGNTIYVPYRDIEKSGSSYTFNLTNTERQALLNAVGSTNTSLKVRFYIKYGFSEDALTYVSLDRTLTIKPAKPLVVIETLEDINESTTALTGDATGTIIAGYSDIHYKIKATPRKGATIASYSAINGNAIKKVGEGYFNNTRNGAFVFTVQDSRGQSTTGSVELNVIDYFKTTCNQEVALNMDGTIVMTLTGKYWDGSFGAVANTLTIETRHRETGGEWSEWGDISVSLSDISNGTYTLTTELSDYDPSGTYEFQSRAVDKLHTATSGTNSVTLLPIFDWGRNDFNFNVPVTIEGNPLDDYVIDYGTESMGSNGTWYWRKWKSGRAEAYGCRNFGNMGVTTSWGNLYRSGAFEQLLPGCFSHTPEVIDITLRNSNFGGWICKHESYTPNAQSSGGFIVVRPASATMSQVYISFSIVGRWK